MKIAPWAVTPEKIEAVVGQIVQVARPSKIVLFGSAVMGRVSSNSDADILVVTKEDVAHPRKESIKIRRALRGILMPMDILVVSERRLKELGNSHGLVYREALKHGKMLYEATA